MRFPYFVFLIVSLVFPVLSARVWADEARDATAAANGFYSNGDYPKAVDFYRKALSQNPQNAAADIGLGNTYYRLGQKDLSLSYYQKALDLEPNNSQVAAMVANLKPASAPTAAQTAFPREDPVSPRPFRRFELDLSGSLEVPNNSAEIGFGFGGRITGGYRLDPQFSLLVTFALLDFEYSQDYTQTSPGSTAEQWSNSTTTNLECLVGAKYRLSTGPTRPYLWGGAGLSNLSGSNSSASASNGVTVQSQNYSYSGIYPAAEAGGGIDIPVGDGLDLFFQAQYDLVLITSRTLTQVQSGTTSVFVSNNLVFTDFPVEMGIDIDF